MYFLSSKVLKRFVLVAFVAAVAVTLTPSRQASSDMDCRFLAIPIAAAQSKMPPAASRKVDYKQDIQPLLAQKCYSCHGPEVQQAGLRLDERER